MKNAVTLPDCGELAEFKPVAYFDKYMDCIRVLTHDRSITEHRLNETFTLYECNNPNKFDPKLVGFAIKGVKHIFNDAGLNQDGVYTLAELIDKIIRHSPDTTMSVTLLWIFSQYSNFGDLRVQMTEYERLVA